MARALFGIVVAVVIAFALSVEAQPTDGNVNFVTVGTDATETGLFRLTGPKKWVETGTDHATVRFQFHETQRDAWGVVLRDDSRGVDILLNFEHKRVSYKDTKNTVPRQIATILTISSRMNGWLVKNVEFEGGSFTSSGTGWAERAAGNSSPRFRFRETARDDWSVYLRDDSRSVDIQLDLHTGNIYYSDPKTPRGVLYKITRSS